MNRPAILYVDDNPEHQALIRQLLESRLGVVVDLAQTASGAEEMLNRFCYDLLICDVNLTGELGTAIVKRVLEHDPGQPALVLTAYRSKRVVEEAEGLGVACFDKLLVAADVPRFVERIGRLVKTRPCEARRRRLGRECRAADVPGIQITSPRVTEARRANGSAA